MTEQGHSAVADQPTHTDKQKGPVYTEQGHSAVADQPTHTDKQKGPVYTAEHPEFPKLLYNVKNRTVVEAKDKDSEDKLKGKGYTEDSYPPLPPDQMTPQDIQQLESLLHKMLESLAKYSASGGTGAGSAGATATAGGAATPPPPVSGSSPYPGATGAGSQANDKPAATDKASAPPPKK